MQERQLDLVQESFKSVEPISETAAALFYGRLFELDPRIEPMFKADLAEQGRKLMATLGLVVKGLKDLKRILPAVRSLGARHVEYGTEPEHYATVGEALLWTLEQGLGDAFTPETREAWTQAYELVAGQMIEAASEARVEVAA